MNKQLSIFVILLWLVASACSYIPEIQITYDTSEEERFRDRGSSQDGD